MCGSFCITKVVPRYESPFTRKCEGFLAKPFTWEQNGDDRYKEESMSKELAKTYDPKGIEERLYQKWMDNGYFHAKVNPDKTIYHCDAAAECNRAASYGTCIG